MKHTATLVLTEKKNKCTDMQQILVGWSCHSAAILASSVDRYFGSLSI